MSDSVTRRHFLTSGVAALLASRGIVLGDVQRLPQTMRRTLRAAIDVLVPEDGHMPAASAIGGVEYLEGIASADRALRKQLTTAIAALGGRFARRSPAEQVTSLARLERAKPAVFATLRDAVYEAYYTNPIIWSLIGYDFRRGPHPTATLATFDERTLDRVKHMARLYREVSDP